LPDESNPYLQSSPRYWYLICKELLTKSLKNCSKNSIGTFEDGNKMLKKVGGMRVGKISSCEERVRVMQGITNPTAHYCTPCYMT
jgi:hypothetical protein